MNKQELIKEYDGSPFSIVSINRVLEDLKQLDEPQKVEVPQFVADVIEGAREKSPELEDALYYTWGNGSKEFTEWYKKKSNRDRFARAWLDGYDIEKEKRYLVKVKGVSGEARYLNREVDGDWYINNKQETHHFKVLHTRKELEDAGFGEVFSSQLFEVEEVTE